MSFQAKYARLLMLSAALVTGGHDIARAAELTGRVVGVTDGDTLTLLTGARQQVRIRLAEIDAPESSQPWGARAKNALSALVLTQQVRVIYSDKDEYGRTLGRVYVSGKDVNLEMVRMGDAWAYRQYMTDSAFFGVESEARFKKSGLWALPMRQRVAPWDWRHVGHNAAVSIKPASDGGQCGAKTYCAQMTSCTEAQFYLKSCGLRRLDADNDGVACETLCRR
jgi:endonuclease YncB( thermonuclease family)